MAKVAYDIILEPLISEKTMRGAQERKYSFKVDVNANKVEIKKALEELFGVDILKVNIMNCNGRSVRTRYSRGKRSDWKKAIVTLKENSKTIEFYDTLY